ncbi:MAG: SGNH/GDSL hydrolase family protein [Rhodospirillaceae bacterium]|nr:SGNH/GDSL hydrolase family protein [Rhodospirillaceae bacterium]
MPTVLCFGDSNTWGMVPATGPTDIRRHGPEVRWPGVLRKALGAGWAVIEEGLNARTALYDDPLEGPGRSGLAYLAPCLETHWPLDWLVLMLGTNDVKTRFNLTAYDVACGMGVLLDVAATATRSYGSVPRALLVCPPPVIWTGPWKDSFVGSEEKSRALPAHYAAVASAKGALFLDAGTLIASSPVDGIHFDEAAHAALGRAVAQTLLGA